MNGWQGRYGKRGTLRDHLLDHLKVQFPAWVSTADLGLNAMLQLHVALATPAEQRSWKRHSLCNALRVLVAEGQAERIAASDSRASTVSWRWLPRASLTLADLQVRASPQAGARTP